MRLGPLVVAATAGLILLAGCADPAPVTPGQQPTSPPVVVTTTPVRPAATHRPAALSIPSIGASSSLIPLGLDAAGKHEVPDVQHPQQAGWYTGMSAPGDRGPAIVLGHIDGHGQKGVFYRLSALQPGAQVQITDRSGEVLTFVVSRVQAFCKVVTDPACGARGTHPLPLFDREGREQIYADTPGSTLRLVTCGAAYDPVARSYRANIVAFAELQV